MLVERQGLAIWFQKMKNVKFIKKYGHLVYVSKKMKYAILYVDMEEVDEIMNSLKKLPYIRNVEVSSKPYIKTEFESVKAEDEKEYDYKMGI
ncbi:uncharacterized protein YlbG (UPF0298 family) [Gracilibacillus halotolerans]|uniref:UPF0298 protein GGQ92_000103 n=1 Tax=Gracilibacillus halotolerans TaxID=74386 RepID=A0A841RIM8_9BACI|nr:DUF2129 domain-containing protein [Gracilibacillus halotolerans]MBB6511336.1 uncharacterized protein YlbG (UPF0298 family) [Gracilibacillus halotolerans]